MVNPQPQPSDLEVLKRLAGTATVDERRKIQVAVHESGHAFMAWSRRYVLKYVRLGGKKEGDFQAYLGYPAVLLPIKYEALTEDQRVILRHQVRDFGLMSVAGMVAERCFGFTPGIEGSDTGRLLDLRGVTEALGGNFSLERRIKQAYRLLMRPKALAAVAALAYELYRRCAQQGSVCVISGTEAQQIMEAAMARC